MIANEDRKTTGKQRLIILAIAAFMLFSTFALYAGIVLSYSNNDKKEEQQNNQMARFQELYTEYQNKVTALGDELSGKHFNSLKPYLAQAKAFNKASIATLATKDLKKGDGREIKYKHDGDNISEYDVDYAAYYIGWLSDETIFDSSFNSTKEPTKLNIPLYGSTQMIQGWLEGIEGMRIGGVREIEIPSILGYGDKEQSGGEVTIPANSPLKFIVMLIEKPAEIEKPEELVKIAEELGATNLLQY
jgi:FKBP-type peptidyl-prolyl cis-trans isomerase